MGEGISHVEFFYLFVGFHSPFDAFAQTLSYFGVDDEWGLIMQEPIALEIG